MRVVQCVNFFSSTNLDLSQSASGLSHSKLQGLEPLTVLSALRVYDTPHQADEDKRQHGVRTDLHGQRRGN